MYGLLGVVSQSGWSLTGGLPKVAPCYTPGALSERTPSVYKETLFPCPLLFVSHAFLHQS